MELHWSLILFTTLVAWSAGLFGAQAVAALSGKTRNSQFVSWVVAAALLVASGIAVFLHLQHWERIFNGFGHITSAITQELIAIVALAVVALVYLVFLRKSEEGGTVPAWCAILAIIVSALLVVVMAHSYMMAARPAWDSILWILVVLCEACAVGPLTFGAICAVRGDETAPMGMPVLIGTVLNALATLAYGIFLQSSESSFSQIQYYSDPTQVTSGMVDVSGVVSGMIPVIWVGAIIVGAFVPLACGIVAWKKSIGSADDRAQNAADLWKILGIAGALCVIIGAICVRVAFYSLGFSVFTIY